MPLFEYQCKDCGARFEALVIGSRTPDGCPRCGSAGIEKQFSTFGLGASGSSSPGSSWKPSACGPTGGG
jgi:putative FmdB family regulatory protein